MTKAERKAEAGAKRFSDEMDERLAKLTRMGLIPPPLRVSEPPKPEADPRDWVLGLS